MSNPLLTLRLRREKECEKEMSIIVQTRPLIGRKYCSESRLKFASMRTEDNAGDEVLLLD